MWTGKSVIPAFLALALVFVAAQTGFAQAAPAAGQNKAAAPEKKEVKPEPSVEKAIKKEQPAAEALKPSEEKINFSGQWTLNKEKSELSGFPAPTSLQKTIQHADPDLKIHSTQVMDGKTTTADLHYFTNVFETKNFINGLNAYSTAHWEGPDLVIHTNLQGQLGGAVVIDERWSLSQDKNTLTTDQKITTTKGEVKTRSIWTKGGKDKG